MVKIVVHRGAAGYAPENTILSFQTATKIGCDRTELDVRLSKDNQVVVFHDEEISRVTNGAGFVHELSLAELKKFDLPDGQKIPTLQEVIDICKNKIDLQIELKAQGTPRLVNEILLKNAFVDHAVITSFDSELLQEIKKINPNLKVGLLFREYSTDVWKLVEEIPLDFIGPRGNIVTEELVNKAHRLGKPVYAYHVKEKELGEKLIALGVDEIGTDFPNLFIDS
jgi:glycerophosphoryl diester phosphodiesterase